MRFAIIPADLSFRAKALDIATVPDSFADMDYTYSENQALYSQGEAMSDVRTQVMTALSGVIEPELHRDIVSLNMVRDLTVEGDTAKFTLMLTTPACPLKDVFVRSCDAAVIGKVPGSKRLQIKWGSEV